MYGIIYKATNKVNGKVYIGQTTKSLEHRKAQHIYSARNKKSKKGYFQFALNKYGEDNFTWEVIDTANNLEELNGKEEDWVIYYGSYGERGYNLTAGGYQNAINGHKVYVFSVEGELLSEHLSQTEAGQFHNISLSTIASVINGRLYMSDNKVFLKVDDFACLKDMFKEVENRREKTRIKRYSKNMVYGVDVHGEAHMFSTIFEAEEKTGLTLKTILDGCEKKELASTKWRFCLGHEFAKREPEAYRRYSEKVAMEMMNLYLKTQSKAS